MTEPDKSKSKNDSARAGVFENSSLSRGMLILTDLKNEFAKTCLCPTAGFQTIYSKFFLKFSIVPADCPCQESILVVRRSDSSPGN